MTHDLAIIGAGNMAEAIVRGVLKARLIEPSRIIAADIAEARRRVFSGELGVATTEANTMAAGGSSIVLLSVKPQQMQTTLAELGPSLGRETLIISIAAGISTAKIAQGLGDGMGNGQWRIVRAMPNTPMLVGEGMVALCAGGRADAADLRRARELFECAAQVVEVNEAQMDAVTAVSGSGPAYVFYLAEQMIAAGESAGLSGEHARALSLQTILGAARMLASSDHAPAELRRKVTSPGGTTQAAIEHMERAKVGPAIQEAIAAAVRRGRELGG
jgi:pyrroline-5-carboxylate reductase